jgi:hypothetical protein
VSRLAKYGIILVRQAACLAQVNQIAAGKVDKPPIPVEPTSVVSFGNCSVGYSERLCMLGL